MAFVLFLRETKPLLLQGLFEYCNIPIRMFFFYLFKLLTSSFFRFQLKFIFFSKTFLNLITPIMLLFYITLFYLVIFDIVKIILFMCFILYCLIHHLFHPQLTLKYKFSERIENKNLAFLNIHQLSPVSNALSGTQLADKHFLNECKC